MRGIDVSSYQGVVDWSQVKATGVEFVILKVIRKDLNPDKQFENNWNGCKSAGVPIQGVYNYSYATTVEKATSDAEKVIQVLNGRKTFVWLDVEDNCQKNLGETLINIINAYKAKIEAAGCSFGVYTGLSFYGSYIKQYSDKVNCPFWIARYPSKANMSVTDNPDASKKPVINHELYGWQYASTGQVPGIAGNVDMNDYYKAIEENSTVAPVQPEQPAQAKKVYERARKVGDIVTVSTFYNASTDGVAQVIHQGLSNVTIGRVITDDDVHNPYRLDRDGEAVGWCNDGDIRTVGYVAPVQQKQAPQHVHTYNVGSTYTLQDEMRVRTGPGTNYAAKGHNGLTADGKKHDPDKDGALSKGTAVTCKEIKAVGSDIWMRTPSGWIAAVYKGQVYVK